MTNRCVVCGKVVHDQAIRIATGDLKRRGWREKDIWGYAHESCFFRAVSSPKQVLEELRNESSGTPPR